MTGELTVQTFETTPRKWGNSLGIVIPKNIADRDKLSEDEKVIVMIAPKRKHNLDKLFGSFPDINVDEAMRIIDETD